MKDNFPSICMNNRCILFSVLVVILAVIFALIEIEIEGKKGWGTDLPTPYLGKDKKSIKLYHLYIFLFIFFTFNMIFFINSNTLNIRKFCLYFFYDINILYFRRFFLVYFKSSL